MLDCKQMLLSKNSQQKINTLTKKALQLRIDVINMLAKAGSGHPAGSLGMADIFAALYFELMNHDPNNPNWEQRDYLILSNGHICPVLYASLARAGYFPVSKLDSLRQIDSDLQGHPHCCSLPGVETSSGPLGQGVSQACGLALALKVDNKPNHVYCLSSDGEQQEGQTWESYLLANKYQLDNLTFIIDRNQIQIEGRTDQVMPIHQLSAKLTSFGINTSQIDGHNFQQILTSIKKAKDDQAVSAVIAETIPGKGVDFMEDDHQWHGKAPNSTQTEEALQQLNYQLNQLKS